jgi:hypothetical protein
MDRVWDPSGFGEAEVSRRRQTYQGPNFDTSNRVAVVAGLSALAGLLSLAAVHLASVPFDTIRAVAGL